MKNSRFIIHDSYWVRILFLTSRKISMETKKFLVAVMEGSLSTILKTRHYYRSKIIKIFLHIKYKGWGRGNIMSSINQYNVYLSVSTLPK